MDEHGGYLVRRDGSRQYTTAEREQMEALDRRVGAELARLKTDVDRRKVVLQVRPAPEWLESPVLLWRWILEGGLAAAAGIAGIRGVTHVVVERDGKHVEVALEDLRLATSWYGEGGLIHAESTRVREIEGLRGVRPDLVVVDEEWSGGGDVGSRPGDVGGVGDVGEEG